MTKWHILFIRAVVGLALALLLIRMFGKSDQPFYVIGLAVIMVTTAYVLERLRKKKPDKD
jgi:putative effector of murein hydrolase LrgA (UPF0299 family)